jgi:CheY-like chemotaxis protein
VVDLAAHLARTGLLAPRALARALAAAHDGDVASAALRLGLADEAVLARALADVHGCPAVDFAKTVVPVANLDALPPQLCRARGILPVSISGSELVLAMGDPGDHALADEVRFVTGRTVLPYAAVRAAVERTVDAVARERARGAPAWRGPRAPALPDPSAAWVGVVHGARAPADLPAPRHAGGAAQDPFAAPSPARRAPPPRAASGGAGAGAGKLALVADPDAEARRAAAALLATLGCAVVEAETGDAALELVRDARPDLVVIEALGPTRPGFEVCRAVKGDPALRETPVILASGLPRAAGAADPGPAFGADAFLEKPWRPEELVGAAGRLLAGGPGAPVEAAARGSARSAWQDGAALLDAGRVEEATVLLREAAAEDDLSAEAHHHLGRALARQGLLFEAVAALARAAELRPDVGAAHEALARTWQALGFRGQACEAWARAVEACADEGRRVTLEEHLVRLLGT